LLESKKIGLKSFVLDLILINDSSSLNKKSLINEIDKIDDLRVVIVELNPFG
jgi:carbonic anhydrase/acetyltransferase-like protein (isoleucine patch superfamily)